MRAPSAAVLQNWPVRELAGLPFNAAFQPGGPSQEAHAAGAAGAGVPARHPGAAILESSTPIFAVSDWQWLIYSGTAESGLLVARVSLGFSPAGAGTLR